MECSKSVKQNTDSHSYRIICLHIQNTLCRICINCRYVGIIYVRIPSNKALILLFDRSGIMKVATLNGP